MEEWPFWQPAFPAKPADMSYEEAVEGTRARLTRSVELRLRADVPIAFSLSGGIDSPALIAIAKRQLGYDVHGFTIMNTDARYEERHGGTGGARRRRAPPEIPWTRRLPPEPARLVRFRMRRSTRYLLCAVEGDGGCGRRLKVAVGGTGATSCSRLLRHHNAYLAAMADADPARHASRWPSGVLTSPDRAQSVSQDPDYFIGSVRARSHLSRCETSRPCWSGPDRAVRGCSTPPSPAQPLANELFHESVPVILQTTISTPCTTGREPLAVPDTDLFD
jgi:asparagine synthase (glutamine-hydrolysing)